MQTLTEEANLDNAGRDDLATEPLDKIVATNPDCSDEWLFAVPPLGQYCSIEIYKNRDFLD